jgi:hypothetical protein
MDVAEYRKQYAAQLARASARARASAAGPAGGRPTDRDDASAPLAVLRDRSATLERRLEALAGLGITLGRRHDLIDAVLALLRDQSEPVALRLAALRALQQASFRVVTFAPKRADYLAALRSVIDDRDAELRRRAIGILAREKDEYVQRRLLEGLEKRGPALVPPAKAIQFLGYDVHAEHFPMLREMVRRPPNRAAKKEAVRLLGSDPTAKPLLLELLNDRREPRDVRSTSAVALQSLDPDLFEAHAKRIAGDDEEDVELRASCLSALAHFASPATMAADGDFRRSVERLGRTSDSPQVKQAMAAYMSRYGA